MTGHSSGEIGAAYAIGALSFESCLSIAYQRGLSAQTLREDFPETHGAMLALGASSDVATAMIDGLKEGKAVIACFNSPSSVTVSGDATAIDSIQATAETRKIFARRLHVNVAYHSPHMNLVADHYRQALGKVKPKSSSRAVFYSSLTGVKMNSLALGTTYWVNNMKLPVQFTKSFQACCSLDGDQTLSDQSVTHVIEIGPHSALRGPVRDILAAAPKRKCKIGYSSVLVRKENSVSNLFDLASELSIRGYSLDLAALNFPKGLDTRKVLSDLPPYPWDHGTEYWHSSRVSQNYRLKERPRNDILGTLVPESTDLEPWWRNILRLDDVPWVRLFYIHTLDKCECRHFEQLLTLRFRYGITKSDPRLSFHLRAMLQWQWKPQVSGRNLETLFHLRLNSEKFTTVNLWSYLKALTLK